MATSRTRIRSGKRAESRAAKATTRSGEADGHVEEAGVSGPAGRDGARARNGAAIAPAAHEFTGRVRLGKRTKRLVKRLDPADIAVIDHAAIDRVSGEDLVASGVRCVVNCARSASPRYGNQ